MDVSWSSKGGLEGRFELTGTGGRIISDIASTPLRAFIEQSAGYLAEKADADTGWVFPVPDETYAHGHDAMMGHMVEAFRTGIEPARDVPGRPAVEPPSWTRPTVRCAAAAGSRGSSPRRWRRDHGRERPVTALDLDRAGPGAAGALAETQADAIEQASQWCADAIAADGLVHLFGTGTFAHPGGGDVPALRVIPRVPSHGRAVDDVPYPGGGGQRPAPGDVHRAGARPRRGHPVELHVRPVDVMMVFSASGPHRGARRDGTRRASGAACGSSRSPRSPSRCPRSPVPRWDRGCSTRRTWSSTCARRPGDAMVHDRRPGHAGRPGFHDHQRRHRQLHQGAGRAAAHRARRHAPVITRPSEVAPSAPRSCSRLPTTSTRGASRARSTSPSEEVADADVRVSLIVHRPARRTQFRRRTPRGGLHMNIRSSRMLSPARRQACLPCPRWASRLRRPAASERPAARRSWRLHIGVSNWLVGNGWREEMHLLHQGAGASLGTGRVPQHRASHDGRGRAIWKTCVTSSAAGVDAIIVNPISPEAVNPAITDAIAPVSRSSRSTSRSPSPTQPGCERPGGVRLPRREMAVREARRRGQRVLYARRLGHIRRYRS